MHKHLMFIVCLVTILVGIGYFPHAHAEDINIYGYAQAYCVYSKFNEPKPVTSYSSFTIQEMDLMFQRNLGSDFSAFVDLQFLNTFSTEEGWGNFNLDEVWIKYRPSNLFNVKFGYLVPTFNALSEIKTKFPIIPYISRPIIYESSYNDMVGGPEYYPTHAALQINGTVKTGPVKIDYAFYGGNSEFITSSKNPPESGFSVPGIDTSDFKLFGGRFGIRSMGIKAGVSYCYDRARNDLINSRIDILNQNLAQANMFLPTPMPLVAHIGDTPRSRLGFDLSYSGYGLTLEAEYISVMNTPDDDDERTLDYLVTVSQKAMDDDLSGRFFYVNVMYDFLEKYFVSTGYAQMKNSFDYAVMENDLITIIGGLGYRLSDNVTLKVQIMKIGNDLVDDDAFIKVNTNSYFVGASVFF